MSDPILVVDDDETVARVLREVLDLLGYPVVVAHTPEEAMERFAAGDIRAVVTDNVMMGDVMTNMSGLELAVALKRLSPATPVIMLSAIPPQAALEVCDRVLWKPVPMRILAQALKELNVHPEP